MKWHLIVAALAAATAALALGAGTAAAHNAAYIILPSGQCQVVGSGLDSPTVPAQNPHVNSLGHLDLIYDPNTGGYDYSDQYGTRFAVIQGNTPLEKPAGGTLFTCPIGTVVH